MKIKASYSNGANIPDGLQYGGMKLYYSAEIEIECPTNANQGNVSKALLAQLKGIIDPLVLKDMKDYRHIRQRCTCKPEYEKGQYKHGETCLMGSAG